MIGLLLKLIYNHKGNGKNNQLGQISVISTKGWLHGQPTCVYTAWNFFRSSYQIGFTVLAKRAGWQAAGDVVPQEAPDNS